MPGTLVVSLDFELLWGVRDLRTVEDYRANLLGVRGVVPGLLDLFERHGVHATWATVGLLFFARRDELLAALPEPARRPRYEVPNLSPYDDLAALGADEASDPYRYGASLVDLIAGRDGQEFATHTFSHYYCLEAGQDLEAFRADLAAATATAEARGHRLRSIVFPRNQVNLAYLQACREAGLVAYRGTEHSWLYATRRWYDERPARRALRLADAYVPVTRPRVRLHEPAAFDGLVDVPASRFMRPWSRRFAALESRRLARIEAEMTAAARTGRTYHLWWHPHDFGAEVDRNLAALGRVLERFARLRSEHGMRSLTMAEVADEALARA